MKVLVTGAGGQLGHDIVASLSGSNHECIATDLGGEYIAMDISDSEQVMKTMHKYQPDAVIHCAAWTAVDDAEDEKNKEKVFAVNSLGTRNVAEACRNFNVKMMYISTDYVFDGSGNKPWSPDCKTYNPLNIYGKSKLEGELAVATLLEKFFIVRIAWVFGCNGKNFVKTMIKLGEKMDTIRVVSDQIGTPTYTKDLAELLIEMIETDYYGYYHATNEGGFISWYDFACEIFRQTGMNVNVIPVTTEEYGISDAARPFNSRLDKSKLADKGFNLLEDWRNALKRFLKELDYLR